MKERIEVNASLSVQPTVASTFGPGVWIERKGGGLIGVRKDEIAGLINALAAGDLELERGAMTAEDESPIAGDPYTGGKPDDFYDRGDDQHPDVW